VTLLLEAGANVNVHGWNSITALHHAANHGELSIAKALLEKGVEVDPIAGEGWGFSTPLHLAAENEHLEIVELLIEKGANVNKRGPKGNTALLLTCSSKSLACLERLIKGNARIDARNDKKQTCSRLAAINGYSDILKILVESCLDPNLINAVNENGNTPLHNAI
jgi:ankyrin repeat protein